MSLLPLLQEKIVLLLQIKLFIQRIAAVICFC
jgi:hypothetical protein